MKRHLLTLSVVALFSVAVGAQAPRALLPQQRGELYAKNRPMIERLVDRTVESARTPNDHLKRADSYFLVLGEFTRQIHDARNAGDSARVAELTGHVTTLVDKGLAPTLVQAKLQVEGGSGQEEFPGVKGNLIAQLNILLEIVGEEPRTRATLEGAKFKVNAITLPGQK